MFKILMMSVSKGLKNLNYIWPIRIHKVSKYKIICLKIHEALEDIPFPVEITSIGKFEKRSR